MEHKLLNLQLLNNRRINIMEDVVMKGHQDAVNGVFGFSLKDGIKRRREDMPLVMQNGDELYEGWVNRDVYDDIEIVREVVRMARSVITKHQKRNYQSPFLRHLNDIGNLLSATSDSFAVIIDAIDEAYKKDSGLFMTVDELNELDAARRNRDPDADYDYFREEF